MKWTTLFAITIFIILNSCHASRKTAFAEQVVIVPRSQWNALPPKPYLQHVPQRITVHHEGTKLEATDDAAKKIAAIQKWGMGPDRRWSDIPYHFLIAPDGTIYEGRAVTTVGETATEYDPTGHLLINCLGNLEVQPLPPAQLQSLIKLIAYTAKKYSLPVTTLSTHRDNSKQTTCPGKNLYAKFQDSTVQKAVLALMN